jgi:hypothetical protein
LVQTWALPTSTYKRTSRLCCSRLLLVWPRNN